MKEIEEQLPPTERGETISEAELKKLCDELYRDRFEIYRFHPEASRGESLLWMLTGCLICLLSADETEEDAVSDADTYEDAVCHLLRHRTRPAFDVRPHLVELAKRADDEQA